MRWIFYIVGLVAFIGITNATYRGNIKKGYSLKPQDDFLFTVASKDKFTDKTYRQRPANHKQGQFQQRVFNDIVAKLLENKYTKLNHNDNVYNTALKKLLTGEDPRNDKYSLNREIGKLVKAQDKITNMETINNSEDENELIIIVRKPQPENIYQNIYKTLGKLLNKEKNLNDNMAKDLNLDMLQKTMINDQRPKKGKTNQNKTFGKFITKQHKPNKKIHRKDGLWKKTPKVDDFGPKILKEGIISELLENNNNPNKGQLTRISSSDEIEKTRQIYFFDMDNDKANGNNFGEPGDSDELSPKFGEMPKVNKIRHYHNFVKTWEIPTYFRTNNEG